MNDYIECQTCGKMVEPAESHTHKDCQSYLRKWYTYRDLEAQLTQAQAKIERLKKENNWLIERHNRAVETGEVVVLEPIKAFVCECPRLKTQLAQAVEALKKIDRVVGKYYNPNMDIAEDILLQKVDDIQIKALAAIQDADKLTERRKAEQAVIEASFKLRTIRKMYGGKFTKPPVNSSQFVYAEAEWLDAVDALQALESKREGV